MCVVDFFVGARKARMIYFISDILDFLPECRNFYFSPFYPLIFASSLRQKHKSYKDE